MTLHDGVSKKPPATARPLSVLTPCSSLEILSDREDSGYRLATLRQHARQGHREVGGIRVLKIQSEGKHDKRVEVALARLC